MRSFLGKFIGDKRAVELDYSLSLFIFILSVAFTLLVVTQYLNLKHAQVGEINEKLDSLKVLDDLCGSPGWMGSTSDWENGVSSLNLTEKVNDQSFFLGLRKNDRYFPTRVLVPSASDTLLQTASGSAITSSLSSLEDGGVMSVEISHRFRATLVLDTNATAPHGSLYAGGDLQIYVTDSNPNGDLRYDTAIIGGNSYSEEQTFNISGRNFTVHTIDQERILLITHVEGGYLMPKTDGYTYNITAEILNSTGVRFIKYEDVLTGGSTNIEYSLFAAENDPTMEHITDLSINKIRALENQVPYEITKSLLGIDGDLNIRIERESGGVILDYGALIPAGDTSKAERAVEVEGQPCTVVVNVW